MSVSARADDTGKAVDWWFAYKVPDNLPAATGVTAGTETLYFDADKHGLLALSPHPIHSPSGALGATLEALRQSPSAGWICYNDERPDGERDDHRKGHTKGLLAFDKGSDTALWLLHSWPKYASLQGEHDPSLEYGQTFLCVTLPDVATAEAIAAQMLVESEPQVYESRLAGLDPSSPLAQLATAEGASSKSPPCDLSFVSRAGQDFRYLAKNRHWAADFWIDWVGPSLGVDLAVETWRRGTRPGTEDGDQKHDVEDVLYVDLRPLDVEIEWHYTKDHSKWAVSDTEHWVCVGDINRQVSQEKRGGGAICFQHEGLWTSL
jgi:deoxyribonuclease-2